MKMEHLGLLQRILSIGKFWSISNAIHRALGNNITTPYPFDKTYYIHYHDYMEVPVILNSTYYHYDYLLFRNQTGYLNVLFFLPVYHQCTSFLLGINHLPFCIYYHMVSLHWYLNVFLPTPIG